MKSQQFEKCTKSRNCIHFTQNRSLGHTKITDIDKKYILKKCNIIFFINKHLFNNMRMLTDKYSSIM